MPAEPLSAPVGRTAELTCTYSTSVGDNFALEWSFVPPGKPISASHPVSWEHLRQWGALRSLEGVGWERQAQGPARVRVLSQRGFLGWSLCVDADICGLLDLRTTVWATL